MLNELCDCMFLHCRWRYLVCHIISQHRLFLSFQSSMIPVISTEMEAAGSAMPLSQRVRTYTECLLVILMTCCFAGATYTSVNVAGP